MIEEICFDILVNGRPVKKYSHNNLTYIEARHGIEYSIRVRNNNHRRKLIVVSVDGINVIDGESAGLTQAGYIISGYSSIDVKGFRTSNESVNQFKFSSKENSYANHSSSPNVSIVNCGVIGIEVYAEKYVPVVLGLYNMPLYDNSASLKHYTTPLYNSHALGTTTDINNTCLRSADCSLNGLASTTNYVVGTAQFDMGTQFSDKELQDKVNNAIVATGELLYSHSIYYASINALKDMGVPVNKDKQIFMPSAFPSKFCRPPTR